MTAADTLRLWAENAALALFALAFLITVVRVILGPTLPDRIVALDMLVVVAVGFIAVIGIKTSFTLYVDVAIALALVGFLATVAFARFVMKRGAIWARMHNEPQGKQREPAKESDHG
jgi:multicomponent Na+:H+ antiporter subunit F